MAKNYTAAEAYKIIRLGIDRDAIKDIAKRYPLFAVMAAKGADELITCLPDFITARKINSALAGDVDTDAETEAETEASGAEKVNDTPMKTKSTDNEEKPKGKRGRPAKPKAESVEQTEEQPKKKRGRPAKPKPKPIAEPEEENDDWEEVEEKETNDDDPEADENTDDEDDWEI